MIGLVAVGPVLRRALLRTVVTAGVLVALLWVVAVTGLGMGLVLPWALARAAPDGGRVSVASADGAWGSRVRLTGMSMVGPETSVVADEVVLEYRLLPLLERTIDLRRVHVVSPSIEGAMPAGDTDDAQEPEKSEKGAL